MDDIDIIYEVEDGYVSGSRPQNLQIDPSDFEDLSDDEIREQLSNQIQDDMLQIVNPSYDESEIVQKIKDALVKTDEEEKE